MFYLNINVIKSISDYNASIKPDINQQAMLYMERINEICS